MRETGARYSDFVIIARDTTPYEEPLQVACQKNDVSCFIDKRIPLAVMPTAVAMMSAANTAKNFTTENILRFHKCGIDILDIDEIATLENYTYLWGVEGDAWLKEWTMDPDGFVANEDLSDKAKQTLNYINELREKAIQPLEKLRNNFNGNAQNMARALVRAFDDCDAAERFKAFSKQYASDSVYRDAVRQSWDSVMKILNSISLWFGAEMFQKKSFATRFRRRYRLKRLV